MIVSGLVTVPWTLLMEIYEHDPRQANRRLLFKSWLDDLDRIEQEEQRQLRDMR